tara:strand:+ start:1285 stop:1455 length:171 start_codon:yes stop_codon:yes gene_type:complete
MVDINNLNINFDDDENKVNVQDNILSSQSNIEVSNGDLYGVELLANQNNSGKSGGM